MFPISFLTNPSTLIDSLEISVVFSKFPILTFLIDSCNLAIWSKVSWSVLFNDNNLSSSTWFSWLSCIILELNWAITSPMFKGFVGKNLEYELKSSFIFSKRVFPFDWIVFNSESV